jgi:hypothetical protein
VASKSAGVAAQTGVFTLAHSITQPANSRRSFVFVMTKHPLLTRNVAMLATPDEDPLKNQGLASGALHLRRKR